MKDTLETINRMQLDGVITQYAIGGAVGATLYLEPSATLDVDIFVMLPEAPAGRRLVSLAAIYEYLTSRGCKAEGEHIVIGSWPVQFLAPSSPLETDAVTHALKVDVEGVPTRVMRAEHLVAIALQTGRAKDHTRILHFLEQGAVDRERLAQIMAHHGLQERWTRFRERYLNE